MGSSAAGELSPAMRERYGLDRSPWPGRLLAIAVITGFVAAMVYVGVQLARTPIEAQLLVWQQPSPDRIDITFEVRRPASLDVRCVLRAQDADRVDVGYAEALVPAGSNYVQQTYQMRVIAPVGVVEILGCGDAGQPQRVPPPAFPPGVVPPEQPWSQ